MSYTLVLFLMALVVAFAPFLWVFQITRLAHSSYRNRLWLLRDRLTDEIRRGEIEHSQSAEHIRQLLEKQIQVAGRHSLKDTFIAIFVFDVDGDTSIFEEIRRRGMPPKDVQKLAFYLRELRATTVNHLQWGSVLGWIFIPTFKVVKAILKAWLTFRYRKDAPSTVNAPRQRSAPGRVEPDTVEMERIDPLGETRTLERAQEIKQKVERAEVEIMPDAAPNRRVRNSRERQMAKALGVGV